MSDAPVFISYSRVNSAFALKLAAQLREHGANIWFDNQNIDPGTLWASEIQQALEAAETMVIILSPESVASNNVLAELNYALNNEKRIIPILIAKCKLPYRIDGIQYIDFSVEENSAFERLCRALGLSGTSAEENKPNVVKQATAPKKPQETVAKSKPKTPSTVGRQVEKKPPAKTAPPVAKRQTSSKSGTWITIMLFVLAMAGFLFYKSRQNKERLVNLKASVESEFSAGRYDQALLAATAFANAVDKDGKGTAIFYRGKSSVMAGVVQKDAAKIQEGLNDLGEVEREYHNDPGATKYFAAIGSFYLADYRKAIDNITLLLETPALRQTAYQTVPGYGVYNLRGESYLHLNEKDKACSDFQEGMKAKDVRASINFSANCRVWQLLQPSAGAAKVPPLKTLHFRTITPLEAGTLKRLDRANAISEK